MSIKIKPVGYYFKNNPIKALIKANSKSKPINPSDYVTISQDFNKEPFNYILGLKSTLANYAKANKIKIEISPRGNQDVLANKYLFNILNIKVSNISKDKTKLTSASGVLVSYPSYEVTKKPFAHELYSRIQALVADFKK